MESVLDHAKDVLRSTPDRWSDLVEHLSPDLLKRSPADGEWSALECLQHLIDTERGVFPVRVRAFLVGQDFPAFNPDTEGNLLDRQKSPIEYAQEFQHLRGVSLEELEGVSDSDLSRKAVHAELGEVTLDEMLHEWAAHDLMHTVQAERALMQPFIEGCGPWSPYFTDHVADQP